MVLSFCDFFVRKVSGMSFMLAFNFNSYIPHFLSNAFNNGFYNNLVQDFAMLECVSYK